MPLYYLSLIIFDYKKHDAWQITLSFIFTEVLNTKPYNEARNFFAGTTPEFLKIVTRETVEKTNETKSCFFKKVSETNKPLPRLTKIKREK